MIIYSQSFHSFIDSVSQSLFLIKHWCVAKKETEFVSILIHFTSFAQIDKSENLRPHKSRDSKGFKKRRRRRQRKQKGKTHGFYIVLDASIDNRLTARRFDCHTQRYFMPNFNSCWRISLGNICWFSTGFQMFSMYFVRAFLLVGSLFTSVAATASFVVNLRVCVLFFLGWCAHINEYVDFCMRKFILENLTNTIRANDKLSTRFPVTVIHTHTI